MRDLPRCRFARLAVTAAVPHCSPRRIGQARRCRALSHVHGAPSPRPRAPSLASWAKARSRLRHRHGTEHRLRRGRDRLRPGGQLDGAAGGRGPQFRRRAGSAARLGRHLAHASSTDAPAHLWLGTQLHPGGVAERHDPADRRRCDRRRGGAAAVLTDAGDGGHGDPGRRRRHRGERRHRAAVPARPRRRHQSARAVPAHGRRCRRFGGRRGGGAADHAHGLAVARSAGEPRDRHRHRSDHLGTAARIDRSVDGRGARRRGA